MAFSIENTVGIVGLLCGAFSLFSNNWLALGKKSEGTAGDDDFQPHIGLTKSCKTKGDDCEDLDEDMKDKAKNPKYMAYAGAVIAVVTIGYSYYASKGKGKMSTSSLPSSSKTYIGVGYVVAGLLMIMAPVQLASKTKNEDGENRGLMDRAQIGSYLSMIAGFCFIASAIMAFMAK